MIAREMIARDASIRDVAGKLDVDESTLRYRLKRPLDAPDGWGVEPIRERPVIGVLRGPLGKLRINRLFLRRLARIFRG